MSSFNYDIYPRSYEYRGKRTQTVLTPVTTIARWMEYGRTMGVGLALIYPESQKCLIDTKSLLVDNKSLVVKVQDIEILSPKIIGSLYIEFGILSLGKSSITCSHRIINKESKKLLVDASVTMVYIDRIEGKSISFPDSFKSQINELGFVPLTPNFENINPIPLISSLSYKLEKSDRAWSILKSFSYVFTIFPSHLDWWNHTNHSNIIQFFEDTKYLSAKENTGFSHAYNRHKASLDVVRIKTEYHKQSYEGQKIKVIVYPLFGIDFGINKEYQSEEELAESWRAIGGEILSENNNEVISRTIIFVQNESKL